MRAQNARKEYMAPELDAINDGWEPGTFAQNSLIASEGPAIHALTLSMMATADPPEPILIDLPLTVRASE